MITTVEILSKKTGVELFLQMFNVEKLTEHQKGKVALLRLSKGAAHSHIRIEQSFSGFTVKGFNKWNLGRGFTEVKCSLYELNGVLGFMVGSSHAIH